MGNGLTTEEEKTIAAVFAQVPAIERAVLFGSRAMGLARSNSDVDIALYGEKLGLPDILHTASLLEDTPLPYQFDLISHASITSPDLLEHIRQYGKEMYRKESNPQEKCSSERCIAPDGRIFRNVQKTGGQSGMTSEWREVSVGELGKVVTGKTPKTAIAENYGGSIPFLTPSDNMDVKHVESTAKKLTLRGLSEVKNCLLPPRSVCVSCIGSDLGKVVITTRETVTNQQINSIIPAVGVDADFLYYAMLILGKKLNHISKTSTAVPIVNKSSFSSYTIKLPKFDEQRTIAATLSSLDDKIENNKRINQHLEQMAFAIFDDMFPCVSNGEHTIGEYITPHRGKGLLSKDAIFGDVPVIAGGLTPATFHNVANTTAPVITISASGANSGFVALWNIPVWSSDSSFIDSSMTTDVFFWYTMLKKRQSEIYEAQTGSAQPHIYPKHIEIMPTIELTKDDVSTYTQRVTPLFEKMGANTAECLRLASLRDALLPRLMSGELSVADLDCAK